jgi:hypothetical protein
MNEDELFERVDALPRRFADRLDPAGLEDVANAAHVGEEGEAVDILMWGLIKAHVPVTVEERDELKSLLQAMDMSTDALEKLNVQG